MVKKSIYMLAFLLSFSVFSQGEGGQTSDDAEERRNNNSYSSILNDINYYLQTFDNGYYGPLFVENGYLFCTIKDGRKSKIPINEIVEVRLFSNGKGVGIYCASNNCVTGVTGSMYERISFRTSGNFNYDSLKYKLEQLVEALKN